MKGGLRAISKFRLLTDRTTYGKAFVFKAFFHKQGNDCNPAIQKKKEFTKYLGNLALQDPLK